MTFFGWLHTAWRRLGEHPVWQALVILCIVLVLLVLITGLPAWLPTPPYDRDALLRGEPNPAVPYYAKVFGAQLLLLTGLLLASRRWLPATQCVLFFSLQLVSILLILAAAGACCWLWLMIMLGLSLGPNPEGLFG